MSKLDSRYSIKPEFCGHATPRFVVRFCGQFVDSSESKEQAEKLASDHNTDRLKNL